MTDLQTAPTPLRLAAVDLGSNSFHLLIVEADQGRFIELEKCSKKVQLAAGLDDRGLLDEKVMERALGCLENFGHIVAENRVDRMRIVGTNALRTATNSVEFVTRAEQCLGQRIETISGREEARLIYKGASSTWLDTDDRALVVDIGGGSTELIIGSGGEPLELESLEMGCVAWTRRFFPDGEISAAIIARAQRAASLELANIATQYSRRGWQRALGSSGTIKAAASVIHAQAPRTAKGDIPRHALFELRRRLTDFRHLDEVALPGLKSSRARVFPAGVVILCAVFEALDLKHMQHTGRALRDGVLLDLLERDTRADTRYNTVIDLQKQFRADTEHAARVAGSALTLFDSVAAAWQLDDDARQLIEQAALLHEIGLGLSHSHYHRHGGYLLTHGDMPGFSLPIQTALGWLVQAHRQTLPPPIDDHRAAQTPAQLMRLARLLRLAVLLNRTRRPETLRPAVEAHGEALELRFTAPIDDILTDDLAREADYQQRSGFQLTFGAP